MSDSILTSGIAPNENVYLELLKLKIDQQQRVFADVIKIALVILSIWGVILKFALETQVEELRFTLCILGASVALLGVFVCVGINKLDKSIEHEISVLNKKLTSPLPDTKSIALRYAVWLGGVFDVLVGLGFIWLMSNGNQTIHLWRGFPFPM